MPFHLRNSRLTRVRLSDRIGAVFQAACMTGELDTAADLLVVLRNVRERGHRAFGVEKRISDDPVAKAQEELATRLLVKRHAPSGGKAMMPAAPPGDLSIRFLRENQMPEAISAYSVEERTVYGGTIWVAIRARGAEWSWLTPAEAARLGQQWVDRYGGPQGGEQNCTENLS